MVSVSPAAMVTVLCQMDDYFASQLRHILDKIQASLNLVKCVMRLRWGRRLVNLLLLAQRTKTFTNGGDGRTSLVVSSNITSTMKSLFKEK